MTRSIRYLAFFLLTALLKGDTPVADCCAGLAQENQLQALWRNPTQPNPTQPAPPCQGWLRLVLVLDHRQ